MQLLIFMISPAIGIAAAVYGYQWLYLVAVGTILLTAALLPAAKHMQSAYVFVQAACSLMPLNISFSMQILDFLDGDLFHPLRRMILLILLSALFLNIEEIFLVLLSRLLWPDQKRIF